MYKPWYICVQNRYSFLLVLSLKNETKVDYHVMYSGESETGLSFIICNNNSQWSERRTYQTVGWIFFPLIEVSFRMFLVEVPVWSWRVSLSLHLGGRNAPGGKDRNLKYCLRFAPHHCVSVCLDFTFFISIRNRLAKAAFTSSQCWTSWAWKISILKRKLGSLTNLKWSITIHFLPGKLVSGDGYRKFVGWFWVGQTNPRGSL